MRELYVYILASKSGVLYVGVTNNLRRRVHEHRTAKLGFTAAYRVHRLVYFEVVRGPLAAIAREKQIKRWTRRKKLALVRTLNPYLQDLASGWAAFGAGRASGRPEDTRPCHPERSEGSHPHPEPPSQSGERDPSLALRAPSG